ncbi:MAG: NAD(P)H-dependent oxidoreductase [Flavobacteriaceae bacterium]|nr:NAD(P)H-dependent oxidoreductase [Flavobacteriaceae bacterium]
MENRTVILQGSSRGDGDTSLIVNHMNIDREFDVLDLRDYTIGHFDYDYKNAGDDFIPLLEKIIEHYKTLVFITPVYWYSMSGRMKLFFDRISDLLHYRKDLGRQLRGKNMAMISVSNANDLKKGFEMPFVESANYLGMHYLGDTHVWVENGEINQEALIILSNFKKVIT